MLPMPAPPGVESRSTSAASHGKQGFRHMPVASNPPCPVAAPLSTGFTPSLRSPVTPLTGSRCLTVGAPTTPVKVDADRYGTGHHLLDSALSLANALATTVVSLLILSKSHALMFKKRPAPFLPKQMDMSALTSKPKSPHVEDVSL